MRPGARELFVSVFVPYLRSETTGEAVQARVAIAQDKATSSTTVKIGSLAVNLDVYGAWSVQGQ